MYHQHFKYQFFKSNKFNIWIIFIIFNLITYTQCLKLNDFTNFTNLNENFKYDSSIPHLATNSITNFELLKNNPDKIYCGCPPKGQFSDSNLGNSKDVPCKYLLNEEAKYACKSGYTKSSGSEKLICSLNDNGKAEWNGKPLNCKIINCTDPGDVQNAQRTVDDPSFSYNSQVSYKCNLNYKPDSKPVLLCDRSGQWNRKKPTCKLIQCPHLIQLDQHLFIKYSDPERKVNSTVDFQCDKGYHLDDEMNSNRVCEWNGNWTNSNPTCVPNYCEIPDELMNELFIVQSKERYYPGDKMIYKCKIDKLSKKYTTVECQQDGNFKPALPTECPKPKKTHCPSIELQHGHVNSSVQDDFIIGAKLTFKCDENFVLTEQKEIHCSFNGEWSSTPPRCQDLATIRTSQILSYILTCIIIILVLIVAITVVLLWRWRQKQLQKRQWQRYFCNLEYQTCDKTKVQNNNPSQEMHIFQAQKISVPFTDL